MTRPTIRVIQTAVATHYDLSRDLMLSDHQSWWISRPRQLAMYLARHLTARLALTPPFTEGER